jgi:hypothetical protein
MIFVNWGDDFATGAQVRNTAVEALDVAEEFLESDRPNVNIFDVTGGRFLTIEELRLDAAVELAEAAP